MSETDYLKHWQKNPLKSLWQHPLWASFQESVGRRTWMLTAIGGSALVVRHPLPFGLCWLEVPRGPLVNENHSPEPILDEIVRLGKEQKAIFVRFSPFKPLCGVRGEQCGSDFRTVASALRTAPHDHHPQTTLLLDLSLSEEDLLKQMKPKGRYNIKVAQKNGVTIRESDDAEVFHVLIRKTAERDGFSVHPASFYVKMLQDLRPHVQLLVAEKGGEPIAGGIFTYLDGTATYYYGASDHAHRNLMAPYLVQWAAIQEAKRRHCKTYDFLGIAPEGAVDHPWVGVTDFKRKFGGHIVHYPQAKELVLRPVWYWIYRTYKRLR